MKTFVRILKFAKPYWPLVIGAFIASIFFSLFNAGSLWVVGTLIGTIMGSSEEAPIDYDNSLSFVISATKNVPLYPLLLRPVEFVEL